MNNDLISREALKKATKHFTDCDGFNPVWLIIDNAPTEDVIPNKEGYEMYNKGYMSGYERGKLERFKKVQKGTKGYKRVQNDAHKEV